MIFKVMFKIELMTNNDQFHITPGTRVGPGGRDQTMAEIHFC